VKLLLLVLSTHPWTRIIDNLVSNRSGFGIQ
jgi:hypothetical protein